MLVVGASLLLTACATVAPPQPPSLDLPKPPEDLQAARKGNRVTLSWTVPTSTTDQQSLQTVGATRICRSLSAPMIQCGTRVGSIPAARAPRLKAGLKTSYVDNLQATLETDSPSATATYAVEVLNRQGRSAGLSDQVQVPLVRTLPPPKDFQGKVVPQGVALSWAAETPPPSSPSVHYAVRVYRSQIGSQQWSMVGDLPLGEENSLVDSNIEWEKTYSYRAETVTIVSGTNQPELQVEGDDTPEVKIFADDVFPPAVPTGVQAVFSGPGQSPFVDLIWAPDTDADLAGYNVYRHDFGNAPVKLNAELVKNPAYRDATVVPGRTYIYSISAVDMRGNESARSEEATEAIPH